MKRTAFLILLVFTLVVSTANIVSAQEKPIIVSTAWLNEHINDANLVIVQVSFLEFEYAKEHIPGARFLWPGWLAPNSPKGTYNAPDPKFAADILQEMGISNNSHIVLCHMSNEVSPTARMFLTLENLGLRGQVSFLNGGLEAWKKDGFKVTNEYPVIKKGKFTVKPGALLVDKDYVLKTLDKNSGLVVDARVKEIYDGSPSGYPRDGHITGAKNIPFTELVDDKNMFKANEQLASYFTPVAPDKGKELVTYCFIGQTASVVYMAGRILGYDMKLYDGSMQEWTRLSELPMEKTK